MILRLRHTLVDATDATDTTDATALYIKCYVYSNRFTFKIIIITIIVIRCRIQNCIKTANVSILVVRDTKKKY